MCDCYKQKIGFVSFQSASFFVAAATVVVIVENLKCE